jgi:hypothetical protein
MTRFGVWGRVLIATAACSLATGALAQGSAKVIVRGSIAPPSVTAGIVVQVDVFRVDRDDFGRFQAPSWRDSRTAVYDPNFPGRPATFEFELEPLQEYQMIVDLLDKEGNRVRSGTYTFSGADMVDMNSERRVTLTPGAAKPVKLPLAWGAVNERKANFLILVQGGTGDYELILSFNENAVPASSL